MPPSLWLALLDPHHYHVRKLLLDELPQLPPAQGAAVAVPPGVVVENSNDAVDVFLELGHLPTKLRQPARETRAKRGFCLFAWFSGKLHLNNAAGQAERRTSQKDTDKMIQNKGGKGESKKRLAGKQIPEKMKLAMETAGCKDGRAVAGEMRDSKSQAAGGSERGEKK